MVYKSSPLAKKAVKQQRMQLFALLFVVIGLIVGSAAVIFSPSLDNRQKAYYELCTCTIPGPNGQEISLNLGESKRDQNATCFTCLPSGNECLAAPANLDSACGGLPACPVPKPMLFQNYAVGAQTCSDVGLTVLYCPTGATLGTVNNVRTCVPPSSLPKCEGLGVGYFSQTQLVAPSTHTQTCRLTADGRIYNYCVPPTKQFTIGTKYDCRIK